jgi:sugar lactone lactonase YvrE
VRNTREEHPVAMNKRTAISIVLALLLIIAGASSFFIFRSTFTRTGPPIVVHLTSTVAHQSEEVPFAPNRARSMVASQEGTALTPWGVTIDNAHGFVWVAEPGCVPNPRCPSTTPGVLGQYALSDGTFIANINEPAGYTSPLFVVVDKEGRVWFTQPTSDALGEYNPMDASWHQWNLKHGSTPFDLVLDAYGNLWFTDFGTNDIGFFDPLTQTVVENPIPTPASNPYGITVDAQGTIWFAENAAGAGKIGSFTPTTSGTIKITEHDVGALRPHLITTDRAGNVWYSGGFNGDIGVFTPRSGNSSRFVVDQGTCLSPTACPGTHISGIAVDSKGKVWFTDSNSQRVGYLLPATQQVVVQTLRDSNAHPYDGLIIDSSDRVWFTEEFGLTLSMWPPSSVK